MLDGRGYWKGSSSDHYYLMMDYADLDECL